MSEIKLNTAMAAAFLRRLGEHLDYNINIMNRDGIIIASKDQARVGTYHASARHLLDVAAAEECIEPGERLPEGTRPGINLPVTASGQVVGVVGITGLPQEVRPLAYAVKTSLESMIELEVLRERSLFRRDRKSQLFAYLVYEDQAPEAAIEDLAERLGYNPGEDRLPVLIRPPAGTNPDSLLAQLKQRGIHQEQDIASGTPDGYLLVFRAFPALPITRATPDETAGLLTSYRQTAERYSIQLNGLPLGSGSALFVGPVQNDLSRYRGAYRFIQWLSRNCGTANQPVYFFDHLDEYLFSLLPRTALDDTLAVLANRFTPELRMNLRSTFKALSASGFNVKAAAARLGVHRNTLSSRLEQLSACLGGDLRSDEAAHKLIRTLAAYLP